MRKTKRCSGIVLLLALGACSSGSGEAEKVRTQQYAFVDDDGVEWIEVGRIEFGDVSEDADVDYGDVKFKDPREMSLDELAQALRPVAMSPDGIEYTTEVPYELARRVMENWDKEYSFPPYKGDVEVDEPQARIIGADDRYPLPFGTNWPYRTIGAWENDTTSGGGVCTLTLIGASTALTAAHCVHNGSQWAPVKRWAFGASASSSPQYPYWPWSSTFPASQNRMVSQCYWVTIPNGWTSSGGSNRDWDFAVVEFANGYPTCNLQPGNDLGWVGWGSQPSPTLYYNDSEFKAYATESSSCGTSQCLGGSCNYPTLWGSIKTSPYFLGYGGNSAQITHPHDTTGGTSGGVVLNQAQGFLKAVGVHWGCKWDITYANYARRLNSDAIGFIQQHSAL